MKKTVLLTLALAGMLACTKGGESSEQTISCNITAPENASTLDLSKGSELIIKGEATANQGEITKVELKAGNSVISEVTGVPFEYTYQFAAGQELGEFVIVLSVEGDEGAKASSAVTITLERSQDIPSVGDGEFLDTRDNKKYKTVKIGEQTWFAENLAYLPKVSKPADAANEDGLQRYFVLNYDGENVAAAKATEEYGLYGVLYNWYATCGQDNAEGIAYDSEKGIQGPCPEGWHVPSGTEWKTLFDYVAEKLEPVKGNGQYIDLGMPDLFPPYWDFEEGLKNVWSALAGLEGWGQSPNSDTNPDLAEGPRNAFGFNVVPSGQCWQTGSFGTSESTTCFWTQESGAQGGTTVTFSNLNYMPEISRNDRGTDERRAYSVRCIQD